MYKISSWATFQDTTDSGPLGKKGKRSIAALYFYYQLDLLVDLAHEISVDFFKRPNRYTHEDLDRVAKELGELRAAYGSNPDLPSREQRAEVYRSIFGRAYDASTPDSHDFARACDELFDAVTAFVEHRDHNQEPTIFRERVKSAVQTLKEYLEGFVGASARKALGQLEKVTDGSYKIFRQQKICDVFGAGSAPGEAWPFAREANGARAIEEISRQLASIGGAVSVLTREEFSNLQRVALRGAEAIAMVVEFSDRTSDKEIDENLIPGCYAWKSALDDLQRRGRASAAGVRQSPVRMHH